MYQDIIKKLINHKTLTSQEVESTFHEVLNNALSESQIAALLTAWNMKGIESDELFGLAQVVLAYAHPFFTSDAIYPQPSALLDVCGTGGDHSGTFNVSTISAIVCAAAGVPVVKHGNRAATSKCGSFDLLEAAGVISLTAPDLEREMKRLQHHHIAFLFAPFFHPSLRIVAPVRKALGFPTVFNILGPLVNPARPARQLIGIAKRDLADLMGPVSLRLGVEKVIFVHGADGLDEVSVSGRTRIVEYASDTQPRMYDITPIEIGVGIHAREELSGGDVQDNLRIAELVINNTASDAQRDFVLANSGLALYAAGKVETMKDGVALARSVLANGKVRELWQRLKRQDPSYASPYQGEENKISPPY